MHKGLSIHPTATVSEFADIEASVRGSRIVVGAYSMVDSFVKIKPAGGSGDVIIGKSSYINSGTVIYSGEGITIGDNVLIAANCTLAPVNHAYKKRDTPIIKQGFTPGKGGITIEDDVWIGAGSVILDGAILRKGCVVGAGSVVNHEIPEYSINVGSPAKLIGYRE
ncbi:acyltransferase [uncultured Pseudodesulfovibrio sp.]|uniref:acyltransferase n=1 Tax=uncultured Pseudodesulfovibrio sp. TaxID=2035858 RepID=UPI0029C6D7B5|nr:acyltransferase [uncultured Pseudodesulfovibrio sp.]